MIKKPEVNFKMFRISAVSKQSDSGVISENLFWGISRYGMSGLSMLLNGHF